MAVQQHVWNIAGTSPLRHPLIINKRTGPVAPLVSLARRGDKMSDVEPVGLIWEIMPFSWVRDTGSKWFIIAVQFTTVEESYAWTGMLDLMLATQVIKKMKKGLTGLDCSKLSPNVTSIKNKLLA